MSLGYAGHAWLEVEDDEIATYSYTGENRNVRDEGERSALESEEGRFTISKSCLIELTMRRKVERLPSGRTILVPLKRGAQAAVSPTRADCSRS